MASKAALELVLQLKGDADAKKRLAGVKGGLLDVGQAAGGMAGMVKTAIGTMGGFIGAQVIMRGVRAVVGQARSAIFDMNSVLETTELRFSTLMGSAEAAKDHVEMLFRFAKETPFETQPIIDASLYLEEFGHEALNTEENIRMIGDAAAAVNAPIEELGMWVGRLHAALEIGAPVGQATRRLMEMAVLSPRARVEIERLTDAGADADEIFQILVDDLGRFTGAMKAQANTWRGITSTIKDSLELLSATALRPIFDLARRAGKTLADMLDLPEMEQGAERIAEALQRVIDRVTDMAQIWVDRLGNIAASTGATLGRVAGWLVAFAQYARGWGQAIVDALAAGITMSINAVVTALGILARIMGWWMAPGSAPRFLPDLELWGRGAAEAWLMGWKDADFGILREFADAAQSLLRGLAVAGRMEEVDIIPTLLGTRERFAEMIQQVRDTGRASEELFRAIREGAGPAGEHLETLARRYARVLGLTARLSEIQRELTVLERQQQARLDVARLAEIEAILADPRATAGQRERAMVERRRIQLLMEQASLEAELLEAEEELETFRGRLDIETETLSLLGQQKSLLESLVAAIKEAVDPLMQQLRTYQLQQAELRDLIRLAEIDHKLANDSLTVAQRTALELEKQAIQAERLIRAREAAEIGVDLTGLEAVPIVPADYLASGGGMLGDDGLVGAVSRGVAEIENELAAFDLTDFYEKLGEMRTNFETEFGASLAAAKEMTENWPKPEEMIKPLIDTLQELNDEIERTRRNIGRVGDSNTLLGTLGALSGEIRQNTLRRLADLFGHLRDLRDVLRDVDELIGATRASTALLKLVIGASEEEGLLKAIKSAWSWYFKWLDPLTLVNAMLSNIVETLKTFVRVVEGIKREGLWGYLTGRHTPESEIEVRGGVGRIGDERAGGAVYHPGGWSLVGERGAELVRLPRGSRVYPAGETAMALAGANGGDVHVHLGPVTINNDMDVEVLAYRVSEVIRRRGR